MNHASRLYPYSVTLATRG